MTYTKSGASQPRASISARQMGKNADGCIAYPFTEGSFLSVFLLALHGRDLAEAVDLASLHGAKDAVAQAVVLAVKLGEQLLHLLALGVAVCGAGRCQDGKLCLLGKVAHVLLGHIDHRADQAQVGSGKIGHGREAAEASLKKEVEHEGLHRVVKMMPERHHVAAKYAEALKVSADYLLGDDESMQFEAVGSVNFSTAARNTILQKINAQINTDIIDNISNVYATSESMSHRVYLPYSQTDDGINSLTGPSFIAIISGRGFTTNGFINKTVMSGYKTVRKMYVVGYSYRNKNGGDMSGAVQKRYCYETQLPKNYENGTETRGPITVEKFYTSIEKAAEDGYYPDLEYLQHRIDYDAKH